MSTGIESTDDVDAPKRRQSFFFVGIEKRGTIAQDLNSQTALISQRRMSLYLT